MSSPVPAVPGSRALRREWVFLAVTLLLLGVGLVAGATSAPGLAKALWTVATAIGLVVSVTSTIMAALRRELRVDVIAVLALAGALWIDEPLAGAIITLMLASGRLLEARASSRAERDLTALVSRAPTRARRIRDDRVEVVDVAEVARGDVLVVPSGEVVPVDGRLRDPGTFDESSLTGEPSPVERETGEPLRSGVVNAGAPVRIVATSTATDSTYAAIVRMVEEATAGTAPLTRLADRFAAVFVPLTVVLAGGAWLVSGDVVRAVAVLVVATPCPLLLAAPIAVMSGLSRCSRTGVIVKGGGVLEHLSRGRVMLFDKTGTLTAGHPQVSEVVLADPTADPDGLIQLAASLDQVSPHPLASAIVACAQSRGLATDLPEDVTEVHGHGLRGRVHGHEVRLGKAAWIVTDHSAPWVGQVRRRAALDGSLTVFAAVDDIPVGAFLLADPIRPDAARMIRRLRAAGVDHVVLLTGDRAEVADSVGRLVGVDEVVAECDPADKVRTVRGSGPGLTIMVGDGVNDAPALAAADVGVALAAQGATASSQSADVVLTIDRVSALGDAMRIAARSRRIAMEAMGVGMGLSLLAMLAAAFGLLPPVYGALLQEAIDVLAIAIALRALLPPHSPDSLRMPAADRAMVARIQTEHAATAALVEQIRRVADDLGTSPDTSGVRDLLRRLDTDLLPHERREEEELYPAVARAMGGNDPLAPLSRTHAEIAHAVSRLHRLSDEVGTGPVDAADVVEFQRLLYGLYAVVRLHKAQEDEYIYAAPR